MINLADLVFCIGAATVLIGAWSLGMANGLIASGIVTCLLAVVLRHTMAARKDRRGRR